MFLIDEASETIIIDIYMFGKELLILKRVSFYLTISAFPCPTSVLRFFKESIRALFC